MPDLDPTQTPGFLRMIGDVSRVQLACAEAHSLGKQLPLETLMKVQKHWP